MNLPIGEVTLVTNLWSGLKRSEATDLGPSKVEPPLKSKVIASKEITTNVPSVNRALRRSRFTFSDEVQR